MVRTAWVVCTTQIGLLRTVVADPFTCECTQLVVHMGLTCNKPRKNRLQGRQSFTTLARVKDDTAGAFVEIIIHAET